MIDRYRHLRIPWVAPPILAVAVASLILATATPSVAYDGTAAAVYANTWANARNPNYHYFTNDCQNFVSQAVHEGGFSYVGLSGSTTDDHNWWFKRTPQPRGYIDSWTITWTVQSDYDTFLLWTVPGGYDWGTYYGYVGSGARSGLLTGDVLFYNWDYPSDTVTDHSAIQVLTGNYTDPMGWVGDEIDAHSNDRAQVFWALTDYNPNVSTTSIAIDHIDPSNP